jgi:hypothetical protein
VRKLVVAGLALALVGLACQQDSPKDVPGTDVLEEGQRAPNFHLVSSDGEVSLVDYRGEKPVLLYFSMGPG